MNLLPNTCNFHHNFWLIFSLHLSENAQNVHFKKLNFNISRDNFQSVILTMILRILRTQKYVSFLSRKGCTSRIVQRYIF